MVGNKKIFLGTKKILEKDYFGAFQNIMQHTHKSPLRNDFFFVYHKLGWDME